MMVKKVESVLEIVEIAGKTALSVIPVGGALITAVYDSIKGNCLAKRQESWMKTVEERLSKLEKTLDDIGNNEIFTTTLIKTTEIAMKSSCDEKLLYLAEAVVNSAQIDINETLLLIFLNMIDKYTIAHIKMIEQYYKGYTGEPNMENEINSKVFNDLVTDSLILYSNDARGEYSLAPLGRDFLEFIKIESCC